MSQQQIIKLLEQSKELLSILEIRTKLNLSHSSISHALKVMVKYREIQFKFRKVKTKRYCFYAYIPIRFYYIKKSKTRNLLK